MQGRICSSDKYNKQFRIFSIRVTRKQVQEAPEFSMDFVLDLSVTELLVLQFLMRHQVPIVRIVLLETLNSVFTHGKKIPPSSFYHKLDKLIKRGFVKKFEDQKIQVTEMGRMIIYEMHRITALASVDALSITQEMTPKFLEESGLGVVPSLLIVNLEEGFDVRMIDHLSNYGDESYIVANDEVYRSYKARDMDKRIKQTKHLGAKIREANDFFDGVIILGYDCNILIEERPTREWLAEAMRVIKPGAFIVVSSVDEIPETDHFIADALIKNINESKLLHKVGPDELVEELKSVGLEAPKVFTHKGLVLGWGTKLT